jgi:hypothetical protein
MASPQAANAEDIKPHIKRAVAPLNFRIARATLARQPEKRQNGENIGEHIFE